MILSQFFKVSISLFITLLSFSTLIFTQSPPVNHQPISVRSEGRTRINLNKSWKFHPEDIRLSSTRLSTWQDISLPHTWNAEDTVDDVAGYRTGVGWYRKEIFLSASVKNKRLFLYFEGVNQTAEVFLNNKVAGKHVGGYTACSFDITELIDPKISKQILTVKVDNSFNPNIPPSSTADFNMYGGIYRDVWLIATDQTHFSLSDYASSGVYVETPEVSAEKATVKIRGLVANQSKNEAVLSVVNTILDASGQSVTAVDSELSAVTHGEAKFEQTVVVNRPKLWSPETPHLYRLKTELYKNGKLIDEVTNPLGFRWFKFDPNEGFFLNGKPYKLRGTNRHQDFVGIGNALSNEQHVRDLEIIKDNGFNTVLLAHYPHDPAVLESADRLGLIVWEELPLVRQISTSSEYARLSGEMLKEMIRQHYNHPSIIMWCYMNEIFLRPLNEPGYVVKTVALAKQLEEIAFREDPARYTAVSANRPYDGSDIYHASGLMQVPEVVAWHMYFGWYYASFKDFGLFIDAQHRRFPNQNIFVSEYGADYDTRLHSLKPAIGDGTAEWARAYHESYLEQIEARKYLAGSAVWAQFDFGSEVRGDSRPHVNTKGIYTSDRKPKDIAYLYRSYLSKKPTLHIASRDWSTRIGVKESVKSGASVRAARESARVESVTVYSNLPQVELVANGQSLGVQQNSSSRKLVWVVPLKDGMNKLEARGSHDGKPILDRAQIRLILRPEPLAGQFLLKHGLNVNVGDHAEFRDSTGRNWLADQPYKPGGWGYVGGDRRKKPLNVFATVDDPLFQTFFEGISAYKFDVPDGIYEVELRFAEMDFTEKGQRVINVLVNGKNVLTNFDVFASAGKQTAAAHVFLVKVKGGHISVDFVAVTGETVLSGIAIRRVM